MKYNIIGGSYDENFSVISVAKTINLFQESTEGYNDQINYTLKVREGLKFLTNINPNTGGPNRGMYSTTNNKINPNLNTRAFIVHGNKFFEFFPNGDKVVRGTLETFTGQVQMCDNGFEILLVDGKKGYLYDLSTFTATLTVITSINFPPNPIGCCFQSSYFVVIEGGTQRFHISRANNGSQWDVEDVASAESDSDNLVAIQSSNNNIWLFGKSSYEVWTITDNIFPFQRITGAANNIGVLAIDSISQINNIIYFIGSSKNGYGFVYETSGYSIKQISDYVVSQQITKNTSSKDAISFTYNNKGHYYYILTFTTDNKTFCYDINEKSWTERTSLTSTSVEQRWKALNYCFFEGKNYVGDINNSNVYLLDDTYPYDDNNAETKTDIVKTRITPYIFEQDRKYLLFKKMELLFESGEGIEGQFTTGTQGGDEQSEIVVRYPQINISWSDDYGKTWSNERQQNVGGRGQYEKRVLFTMMGSSRCRAFKIRWSDPINTPLVYGTINLDAGKF